jgi:hypothetical protein
MNDLCKKILNTSGILFENAEHLNGMIINRDELLSIDKYQIIKTYIPELKKEFSSSFMTGLQETAEDKQKWPLLNLVRQILSIYKYKMTPKRLANGYEPNGKKKFIRIFIIEKIVNN